MFLACRKLIPSYIKQSWWQFSPQTKESEAPLSFAWRRETSEQIPVLYLFFFNIGKQAQNVRANNGAANSNKIWHSASHFRCTYERQTTYQLTELRMLRDGRRQMNTVQNLSHTCSYHVRALIGCIYVACYRKYMHDLHAGERSLNPNQKLDIIEWRLSCIPQSFRRHGISTGFSDRSHRSAIVTAWWNNQQFRYFKIPKWKNLTSCR